MINFDETILDLDGKPVTEKDGDTTIEITLERICITALMAQGRDDNPSGEEKFKRFLLATKLKGTVALKAEEISMLKKLIGAIFTPLIVGRAWQLLDAAEKDEDHERREMVKPGPEMDDGMALTRRGRIRPA